MSTWSRAFPRIAFIIIVIGLMVGLIQIALNIHNTHHEVTIQHEDVTARIELLRSDVVCAKDAVLDFDSALDVVEGKVDTVQDDVDLIQVDTTNIDSTLTSISADAASIDTKLDTISVNNATICTKIDALHTDVLNVEVAVSGDNSDLISALQITNTHLSTVLQVNEETAAEHAGILSGIDAVASDVSQISMDVSVMQVTQDQDHAEIDAALSSIQQGLDTVPSTVQDILEQAGDEAVSTLTDSVDNKLNYVLADLGVLVFEPINMIVTGAFPNRIFHFDAVTIVPTVSNPDSSPTFYIPPQSAPPNFTLTSDQSDDTAHFTWDESLAPLSSTDVFEIELRATISNPQQQTFSTSVTLDRQLSLQPHPEIDNLVMGVTGVHPNRVFTFGTFVLSNPGGSDITFSIERLDVDGDGTSMPTGHTFDTVTGAFAWSEVEPQHTAFTLQVTATDAFGLSDSKTVQLIRSGVPGPAITNTPVLTVTPAYPATFSVNPLPVATDPFGDGLTWSLENIQGGGGGALPLGHTFDPQTGAFEWTEISEETTRTFILVLTVTDANFQRDSRTFTLIRPDVFAPVVTLFPDPFEVDVAHATRPGTLEFTAVANDEADSHAVTFSLSAGAPTGTGANAPSLDQNTGEFSWTPVLSQVGDYAFDIEVSDGYQTSLIPVTIHVYGPLSIQPIPDYDYPFINTPFSYQALINGRPPLEVTSTVLVDNDPNKTRAIVIDPTTHLISSFAPTFARNTQGGLYPGFETAVEVTVRQPETGAVVSEAFTITNMAMYPPADGFAQLPTMYWPADDNTFITRAAWTGLNIQSLGTFEVVATVDEGQGAGFVVTSDVHLLSPVPSGNPQDYRIAFTPDPFGAGPPSTFQGFPAGSVLNITIQEETSANYAMTFQVVIETPLVVTYAAVHDYLDGSGPLSVFPTELEGMQPFSIAVDAQVHPWLTVNQTTGEVTGLASFSPGSQVSVTLTVAHTNPLSQQQQQQQPQTVTFVINDVEIIQPLTYVGFFTGSVHPQYPTANNVCASFGQFVGGHQPVSVQLGSWEQYQVPLPTSVLSSMTLTLDSQTGTFTVCHTGPMNYQYIGTVEATDAQGVTASSGSLKFLFS